MTAIEPNATTHVPGFRELDGVEENVEQIAFRVPVNPAGLTTDPSGPYAAAAQVLTGEELFHGDGQQDLSELDVAAPIVPPVPIPLPFRTASGRYRSQPIGFQLELRVDIDGRRPLGKLSGDYYAVSGATVSYFGSWTVDAVTVAATATTLTIVGTARTTWPTTFTVATVTIPRARIFQPAPPASIRWSTPTGAIGATYICAWAAGAFRTVELEQDCESGVTPLASYNTGSQPSGGPTRTLSTAGAYGEAGLQMLDTGGGNIINTAANHVWNNASLHNAMQAHFSQWQEAPQWKVWLLHAQRHELTTPTSTLLGIMFDQQGLQRQGCATFYERIATNPRTQLYTCVHELGHCFNLFHSFHKQFMNPPMPNRVHSLSWMNYPRFYVPLGGGPTGEPAFWAAFPFQFDDLELTHLRHGFRNAVIMGGNPFGIGAAFEAADDYANYIADTTGLRLQVKAAHERPILGMPIVLDISLTTDRSQRVNAREQLHPKYGFVQVVISRPRGDVIVHRPPVTHCATPELVLPRSGESLPISAYVGYDAAVGQIFEDPGVYKIRATYAAPDGNLIISNLATVRVGAPHSVEGDIVADLMLGDQTGMALTLLGTDSPYLSNGMDALETVAEEYSQHPSAIYARLALGMNQARPFAAVQPDGDVIVREPDLRRADYFLRGAIDESRGEGGLDNKTVYQAAAYLADSHAKAGDTEGAQQLRADIRDLAQQNNEPPSVIQSLEG
ncbi:hypothetical protein LWC34_18575 [Kibdelosporangium philippinense]|uniref:Uncharacterized protein n=1 Tax=Kibdelosporangium philippinense TaxID=211113 RepID=A0ABS8ZCR0_9PSEU|nr:hypothetical protein [Kibdelosporangium philippinense]MCE7004813.1 hypothetical protein [Kibdelosporangium philippinense]